MSIPGSGHMAEERSRRRDARERGQLPPTVTTAPAEDDVPDLHWSVRHKIANGQPVTVESLSFRRADGTIVMPNIDEHGYPAKDATTDALPVSLQITPATIPLSPGAASFFGEDAPEIDLTTPLDVLLPPAEGDLDAAMAAFEEIAPILASGRSDETVPLARFAPTAPPMGIVSMVDAEGVTLTVATLAYVQAWEKRMEAWLAAERAKDATHRQKQDQAIGNVLKAVSALLGKN